MKANPTKCWPEDVPKYLPFHETLPGYSASVNWISVRFYETDCNSATLLMLYIRAFRQPIKKSFCFLYCDTINICRFPKEKRARGS